jgi:predicted NBD/HSP70 family sugar kinase
MEKIRLLTSGLKILGDGQIWDLRGILPKTREKTFEDLFSGRALAQMASKFRIFSRFKEKGRITGLSVTKALLSNDPEAKKQAKIVLEDLAKNGALGIKTLVEGKGSKENWSRQKKYWRNLNLVIIGGGVSEGTTGRILIRLIKKYLSKKSKNNLSKIKVYQAIFSGKEAGFLGAVINILKPICNEAKKKGLNKIAAIGLDLGREKIGIGLLVINTNSEEIILKRKENPWLFRYSVRTPGQQRLKSFLDSRTDYTNQERIIGQHLRKLILKQMTNLIIQTQTKAQEFGLENSRNIGVAVPGCPSPDGSIINSTDYLPFFRKQDGFNFKKRLEESLTKKGMADYHVYIINDGIAAGIANIYFDSSSVKRGKFAFLGVGSGLGGCLGLKGVK